MDQPPDIPQRPMGRIPVVARLVRGKGTLRTYGEQLRKALTCDPATMMQITSAAQRARVSADRRRVHGCAGQAAVADPAVIKSLEGQLSASTIKGITGWVSTIFKAAIDDGIVARNPFDAGSVRRPRVQATKAVPWAWRRSWRWRRRCRRVARRWCSWGPGVGNVRVSCLVSPSTTSTSWVGSCMCGVRCGSSTACRCSPCPRAGNSGLFRFRIRSACACPRTSANTARLR